VTASLTRVALINAGAADAQLRGYLSRTGITITGLGVGCDAVLALVPDGTDPDLEAELLRVAAAGTPVLAVGPRPGQALADTAGLLPGRLLPVHEVRVRPGGTPAS